MKKLLFLLTLFITSILASSYAWANFSISGSVLYRNATNTPMNATQVKLYQGSTLIKDTLTDISGNYIFNNIPSGIYRLELYTSKTRPENCLNIQDIALLRMKVGGVISLDTLQMKAANINMDAKVGKPYVNIQDVSVIRMKNGGLNPSQWLIPDWLFAIETATSVFKSDMDVQVIDADQTVNIRALCSGDIDGSSLQGRISGNISYPEYSVSTYSPKMFLISSKTLPFAPWVKLLKNGIMIDSLRADSLGDFSFPIVKNDDYTLQFEDNHSWPTTPSTRVYQLTLTDVTLLRQFANGVRFFDSLQIKACNVNMDFNNDLPIVDSIDVEVLRSRSGGNIPSSLEWSIPNWLYGIETSPANVSTATPAILKTDMTITVNSSDKNLIVRCLSPGDVNGKN